MPTTFAPTPEQQNAVELFRSGQSLAIEAGAGTGKTSTLLLLAEAMPPGKRGQYVAFNKAIVTEAGSKFPAHVACNTAHSLAFRAIGRQFSHRLNAPRMRSDEIARRLGVDPITVQVSGDSKRLAPGFLAGHVMRAVTRFCQSADEAPEERHFEYIDGIDTPGPDGERRWDNNRLVRRALLPAMRKAWADFASPEGQLPYRHDHYLKAWHLSGPEIPADVIFFDEAQDANPVLLAIVAAQADHAQLVFVGDSQQQIYEFTGAVNALASVPADLRAFLTQSFRFGPAVASVANGLLARLEADLRIQGFDKIASVVGPIAEPRAILCRTNAKAVQTVLTAQREGRRVHLVGGGGEVSGFARAAIELREKGRTGYPELACFGSWGEVQDYTENDPQGSELKLLVGLVDEYGPETIIAALDRMIPERDASLIVSTAHKSKGREWESVQLASDFQEPKDGEELSASELRLLYVAATRAQQQLDVSIAPAFAAAPAPAPEAPAEPPARREWFDTASGEPTEAPVR